MFKCDILISTTTEEAMWMSTPPSGTIWNIHAASIHGVDVVSRIVGEAPAVCDHKQLTWFLGRARRIDPDLTINTHHMDDAIAAVNARYLINQDEQKKIISEAGDLLMPLIDAAIEAQDKSRLADLHRQFPDPVTRACLIDRYRQAFPELKLPGVTLDNWHKVECE